MTIGTGSILDIAIGIGFTLLVGAMVLAFLRLARGPSLPDRVVALDLITLIAVAFCGLLALSSGAEAFLDVAVVLALVAFLATVALARFSERRQRRGDDGAPSAEDRI